MFSASDIEAGEGLGAFLQRDGNKELLRFTTAGSVDDGKSTLIGRLLHDAKAVYEDQVASVKKSRINRSGGPIDFSLLTDGLRAEREQGITIDVAYRYFSTTRRKFIIADTPGHEQYTRNMATGASTADLAVILVDATKGLLPQTRRHLYIASLLGIPNVLAAINKMDLVDYREDVFRRLEESFPALARPLGCRFVQCIPISALQGDNVVDPSPHMPWYSGPTLLRHLETVEIDRPVDMNAVRFPVQLVIRPDSRFRGFAGRVASGVIRPGDEVLALPSEQRTCVESIVSYAGELDLAAPSESVVLTLRDEIDLSRGDMLVSPGAAPRLSSRFAATVVWMHDQPLELNRTYLAKHAGRYVRVNPTRIRFVVDVNRLSEQPADRLEMNGIASVELESTSPLIFDTYDSNRTTGSFLLIDPLSNATVGAGMIREDLAPRTTSPNDRAATAPYPASRRAQVTPEERQLRHGHRSAIYSVADDPALAEWLERALFERGFETLLVREDELALPVLARFLANLLSAGMVIVYCAGSISSRDLRSLQTFAGFLYEISAEDAGPAEESLQRALAFAETLRTGHPATNKGTEN